MIVQRLTALNVFRHAADLGSFAAAARHLRLSPAAVSKSIAGLEDALGARLFNRTTRRMTLTEAGAVYYERVARALDELAEADLAIGAMHDEPRGRLRVSAPLTLSLLTWAPALPGFLERHPELAIDLQLDDRRVDLVRDGFDVVIRGSDRLEDSSLIARRLMTMTHVVCAAPAYFERFGEPAHPDELAAHRCVQFTLSGHADTWTFCRDGEEARVAIDGPYRVTSSLAVRDALRAGYGLSLIPRVYVAEDLESGRLRAVLDDWTCDETTLYAVYPSRRYVVPKVRAFLDFLAERFAG